MKLEFYDVQIYPFLSLIIGLTLNRIYTFIKVKTRIDFAYAFIIAMVGVYASLFARVIKINTNPVLLPQEIEGAFVKSVFKDLKPHRSKVLMTVEHPEHYDQLHFYRKKYAAEFKSDIKIVTSAKELVPNDTVFICQQTNKDSLLLLYEVNAIKRKGECLLVKILNKKLQ